MKWIAIALLLIVLLLVWRTRRPTVRIKPGDAAPAFQLPDRHGVLHALRDYRGRWLIVFFYPRDDTPGCTREACQFRDELHRLKQLGADVVGISVDSVAMHADFAAKYELPFPLLADTQGTVAAQYGVLIQFWRWKVARRTSFIVGPDGRIAHIFSRVDPRVHVSEVTHTLNHLQNRARP